MNRLKSEYLRCILWCHHIIPKVFFLCSLDDIITGQKMDSKDNEIKILNQLGLTVLEAKIYLTLCEYETLTAKAISKLAKTFLPDTYRVTAKLQNKGLIEKILSNPAEFRAVPIDKTVAFLLEKRKADYDCLKAQTAVLLTEFKEKSLKKPGRGKTPQFVMIPKRKTIVAKINDAIERSERSVDLFLSWKRFLFGMTEVFAENAKRAWGRGVKFRIIVEEPEGEKAKKIAAKFCRKNHSLCSIRFLPGRPKTVIGIYDSNEVFIVVSPGEDLFDSPALWSNNQSLLTVVQDYFEILWLTAMEKI
jgi:sugar-specific transcriptional regulator TrmB